MFNAIYEFEYNLAQFTGAPYCIMTDCCTHAIELCFIYNKIQKTKFTPFTYLSVPMTMHKLQVNYTWLDIESQEWTGEYCFHETNIWDSARRLERNMYRPGSFQCLSFGHSKPLEIGRGGAILTDNLSAYKALKEMCYDGRDLTISPWQDQVHFKVGYHYKPTIEEALIGNRMLQTVKEQNQFVQYPDLRNVRIYE
jgi:dTDP-4-amino-4,6-dideoxygalactose transaminase